MPLTNPGGESVLGWARPETVLWLQLGAHVFVTAGIGWVCARLGGWLAATIGVTWWLAWPSAWAAVMHPYYYYWPIPCTIGLACLWLWRGIETRWTLPLLVVWAQLRMTAVGTFTVMPKLRYGLAAWVLTTVLVLMGHGRTQVWHDLYIGIGTHPNPYGVVYADEHAIAFAKARGIEFKAPGYEAMLRDEYLRIVMANPLLIVRNTVLNFGAAVVGGSFFGGHLRGLPLLAWVPLVGIWWAACAPGVYRALVWVWLAQCATLAFVCWPQEGYLWETAGLFVVIGSVGMAQVIYLWAEDWEPPISS